MNLSATVARLVAEAEAHPDPAKAARLLRRRADLIDQTPLKGWPNGVTVPDVLAATADLRAAARRIHPTI